jgi:protein SCO1
MRLSKAAPHRLRMVHRRDERTTAVTRILLIILTLLRCLQPAGASLTQQELTRAALDVPQGARIPPNLTFHDAKGRTLSISDALAGRPALLVLVDFTCRTICGPSLTIASEALAGSGLLVGRDFQLIVAGFDSKDSMTDARAFIEARIGDARVAEHVIVLNGDDKTTSALMQAVGYRVAYDADSDQFAHPAAAFTITKDGYISHAFSSLALNSNDLRLGLVEAAAGGLGNIRDRLILLCSGFDPISGLYTVAIGRVLEAMCAVTVLLLGGFILVLRRSESRRSRETV